MLRDYVKWYGFVSACGFLALSTYIKYVKVAFYDTRVGEAFVWASFAVALLTLVLGLLALPRWQSLFALAVCGYAYYWLSHPAYVIP